MVIEKIKEALELDPRSLAVFRICIGAILLIDLVVRFTDIEAHYTDIGILPRSALIEQFLTHPWIISLHFSNGETWFQAILFLISALFAFSLLIGYRTKLCTVVSWALLISLHNRNPMILNAGDVLLRLLLFWSIFLPLGSRFSIESAASEDKSKQGSTLSLGSIALLIQIGSIYIFGALLKTDPAWRSDYTAMFMALSHDQFATSLGSRLVAYPELLKHFTRVTYYLELVGPLLALIPFKNHYFRIFTAFTFIVFHLSIAATMKVGLFSFVCCAAWLVILPSAFWKKLEKTVLFKRLDTLQKSYTHKLRIPKADNQANTPKRALKALSLTIQAIALIYMLLWNYRTLDFSENVKHFPREMNKYGYLFRWDQYWSMFAPRPRTDDGWYVVQAKLSDGSIIDLLNPEEEINWSKPESVSSTYINQRWRKYLTNIWLKKNKNYREYYAKYLCRSYRDENSSDNRTVDSLTIYYMLEETKIDGSKSEIQKISLWNHTCKSQ